MKIFFIYNFECKDFENIVFKIEKFIKNNKNSKKNIKIERKNKTNKRSNPDIYVILSNDYKEVDNYYDKIKNKSNSIVLTNNISSSNIINLIKNTKNVCYMENDIEILVNKIFNVYLESKK